MKKILFMVLAALSFVLGGLTPAHATIAELFAAVDIAGVSTGVQAILISLIGIGLLFVGYKFVRRAMGR